MWHEIFDQLAIVIAVILCAISVKLVDDFLDQDLDTLAGSHNFTNSLGKGTIIYAMLALTLAISMNALISIPLFFASYSLGMFNDLQQHFPSGLKGWQESLIVIFCGILFWGWEQMFFSLLFMSSVQLFDDYVDLEKDQVVGCRNIASQIGKVECLLLAIIGMLAAWQIKEHMFPFIFLGFFLFYNLLFFYQKRGYKCS